MATGADVIKINDPTLFSRCYPQPSDPILGKMCGDYTRDIFRKYCNQASNYANSEFCQQWCAADSANCPSISTSLGLYCNTPDGFKTPYCMSWCQRNPGYCNDAARAYCETSPDTDICSCLKSPMLKVSGLVPECHDGKCRNYGYKTYTPTSCPDYVDCRQSLEIKELIGDVDLTGVTFEQNCGGTSGSETVIIPVDPVVESTDESGALGLSNTMIIIIVVAFILLILLGLGIAYFKLAKKPVDVDIL